MDEEHPLDKTLGDIHACALAIHAMGLTDWGLALAKAHEKIQSYILEKELN